MRVQGDDAASSGSAVLYRDDGRTHLGWRVLAPVSPTEVYDAIVDASSGAVVRRANRVDFATTAMVFRSNPASGAQVSADLAALDIPTLDGGLSR